MIIHKTYKKNNGSALLWTVIWLAGVAALCWAAVTVAVPRFEIKQRSAVVRTVTSISKAPIGMGIKGFTATLSGEVADEDSKNAIIQSLGFQTGVFSINDQLSVAELPEELPRFDSQIPMLAKQSDTGEVLVPLRRAEEDQMDSEPGSSAINGLEIAENTEADNSDINTLEASGAGEQDTDTSLLPSIDIRVAGDILSVSGVLAAEDNPSTLIQLAIDSFGVDVVSNGIVVDEAISQSEWLSPLEALIPMMASLQNPKLEIAKRQIMLSGVAADRQTHDAIISKALSALSDYALIERISVDESLQVAANTQTAEEARIAAEEKAAEEARIAAEEKAAKEARIAAEEKAAEEARVAAEEKAAEEARIAAEEKAAEEARIAAEEKAAEEARIEAEEKAAEEARIAAEEKAAEEARIAAEEKAAKEARIAAEEKAAEEARIAAEETAAEEARIAAEEKAAEEARIAAEEKAAEEARIAAEEKAAEEARIATEEKAAEEARIAAEEKAAEEARIAAEEKAAEDARIAAEEKAAEEARIAAEEKAVEEARIAAEEKAAEEARIAAEEKAAEEARFAAEEKAAAEAKATAEALAAEVARASAEKAANIVNAVNQQSDPQVSKDLQKALSDLPTLRILFQSSSSVIAEESLSVLDEIADVLIAFPETVVTIEGHTDSTGSNEINLELSLSRATSVRSYLVDRGVSVFMLRAKGLGEEIPIADNNTASGRAINRRIEFKF
ncbi:MAG: OmpA family protein [Granulosicoccus sp.]